MQCNNLLTITFGLSTYNVNFGTTYNNLDIFLCKFANKKRFSLKKNMYAAIFNHIHNVTYQKVYSEHFFFFYNTSLPKVKSFYQSF